MSKPINVRLREELVKNYPNITSSSGNELLLLFFDIYKAVWIDFKSLPEDTQSEILDLAKSTNIKAGEGLRVTAAKILDVMDAASPTTRLHFRDFHSRVGDAGIAALIMSVGLGV